MGLATRHKASAVTVVSVPSAQSARNAATVGVAAQTVPTRKMAK